MEDKWYSCEPTLKRCLVTRYPLTVAPLLSHPRSSEPVPSFEGRLTNFAEEFGSADVAAVS